MVDIFLLGTYTLGMQVGTYYFNDTTEAIFIICFDLKLFLCHKYSVTVTLFDKNDIKSMQYTIYCESNTLNNKRFLSSVKRSLV